MKIIKVEQEVVTPKSITIELTEKELDFIVLAVGRTSIPTAETESKDYRKRKDIEFSDFNAFDLWQNLMKYSNLHYSERL